MTYSDDVLGAAHKACIFNQTSVELSGICACFDCLESFPPNWIAQWIEESSGVDNTARCPHCSNDTVLGDASGFPVMDPAFLSAMNRRWCTEDDDGVIE